MSYRYEIRLSGDIGHGLTMIGKILAEAAAIYDDQNAVQSQSYGEESRGEANRSEVIISDQEIIFPKVEKPDLLLCLSQIAYDRYNADLKPGGILLIDSHKVVDVPQKHKRMYDFPFFRRAKKEFGDESFAGVIALGIIAHYIKIISPRAIQLALMARIPKGTEEVSEKALKLGYQMAKQWRRVSSAPHQA